MLHGFEIGTKPKENGGGIYIHLRAPTNYERFALAIDDKGKTTIEKVLSVFFSQERGFRKTEGLQTENNLSRKRRVANDFDALGL